MAEEGGIVKPKRVRGVFVFLGTLSIIVTLLEMFQWWVLRSFFDISFFAGILMSLPSAIILLYSGYRLPRLGISESYYGYIFWGSITGFFVLGGFSVITGLTFFPNSIWAQIGSIRWGASVGAGTGWLIGYLYARGIEQNVAAERKAIRAEEAQNQQEILEYLNALLRHEVLNTSNIISGHASLIASQLEDKDILKHSEVIKGQAEELASVTEDVKFLLQASGEGPDLEPVDLRSMLDAEMQNTLERYEDVEITLDAPTEVHVMADPIVRRLFSNLIRNAIEHNNSELKRVSISIKQGDGTVTVEIADNGPGILEEDREQLFDPKVKRTNSHGLGLTIVARLVHRYDGDIELTETGSDGSVFTVRLPSAPSR